MSTPPTQSQLGRPTPRRHAIPPSIATPTPPKFTDKWDASLDRDPSASSAPLASTPPLPPRDTRNLRDEPPSRRAEEESLASSPDNRRAESSVYYTTAWGSPYAAPSTRRLSLTLSQYAGVDRGSGASSPDNHPELRRASVAVNAEQHFERRDGNAGRTFTDFTRDWLNQFLNGQPRTERSNWLSDDSGSEAPSFLTAQQNQIADDLSDDWLALDDTVLDSDLLKTPTLSDFVGRRDAARSKTKKAAHKRADTLRQEDFWGFAYDKESPQKMSDVTESQPPAETIDGPSSVGDNIKTQASEINREATQTPQRRKKKLAWKGKACIIDLPVDDNRGSEAAGGKRLLTRQDLEARMKKWEDEGYDIRGFTIGEMDDSAGPTELGGLTRPLYPDPSEVYEEGKGQKAFIRFPNRAVWDAYVADLQEEKLRALGVSFGDDEPGPSVSPSNASINPPQPPFGLVGSPPIPTASAAGNHLAATYPFSPQFGQSTGAASGGIGSLASPASQFSVHTPFMGMEQNMMPGLPFQFQPTPPAQGSMTPQSLLRHANGSAGPGGFHNFNSMLSPVSPLHDQGWPSLPTPQTPVNAPDQFHANVEIAHPTPRGHGHNLSESLQRGLDQMNHSEYRPDDQAERHVPQGEYNNHHGLNANMLQSRWAMPEDEPQRVQHASREPSHSFSQHPHQFFGEQYGQNNVHDHEGSDLDTNPSLTGTPQTRGLPNQSWHEPHASGGSFHGHNSKLSVSSLNVEAKEFDPSASFTSQAPALGQNAFQFGGSSGFGFEPAHSFGSPGFMDAPAPEFGPKRSTFKFSAPSFNVDAPVFNPSASMHSNASSEAPSANRIKIFGDIDINEVEKKDQDDKEDNKNVEDDHSRPVFTDRHKRARRAMGHASEPEMRYSISTHPFGEHGNAQASSNLHPVAEGKENSLPDEGKNIDRRSSPVSEAVTLFNYENEVDAAQSSVQGGPEAQENIEKPAQENVPEASSSAKHATQDSKSNESILSPTAKAFEFKPAVPEFVPTAVQPSSFAESKPIEDKTEEAADTSAPKPAEKRKGGLMASRFATDSPPKSKPPPTSETIGTVPLKASVEINAAAQAMLERYRESTEESTDQDDIDAVMDQLNHSDDELGIERQYTPLPSQFVSDSVGGPTKEKRFGSAEGRSEAPSPSPGGGPRTHKLDIPKLGSDVDGQSNVTFSPQKSLISRLQSPVRQLITENDHVSDWDDMISSGEDEKFFNRNRFFDRRINDLVGAAIDDRLGPMDRALAVIQQSVASIASGTATRRALRSGSAEMEDSDADDEDDGDEMEGSVRARSPPQKRDRKLDLMKSVMMEALATHSLTPRPQPGSQSEMNLLKEHLARLEATISKKIIKDPVAEIKQSIADALEANQEMQEMAKQQARARDEVINNLNVQLKARDEEVEALNRQAHARDQDIKELHQQVDALRATLNHSAEPDRGIEENQTIKEDNLNINKKVKEDLETFASENNNLKQANKELEERFAELSVKNIELVNEQNDGRQLERKNQQLIKQNAELQSERDEHLASLDKLRNELASSADENSSLRSKAESLRIRMEESQTLRATLIEEMDKLKDKVTTLTSDVVKSHAISRNKEQDLTTELTFEKRVRESLEKELAAHEAKQKVFAEIQVELQMVKQQNQDLTSKNADLRDELAEAKRTRASIEADVQAATSRTAEAEARNASLQKELNEAQLAVQVEEERRTLLVSESETAQNTIAGLENSLQGLRAHYENVLSEDKARNELHTAKALDLAGKETEMYKKRAEELEVRLKIAESAARAAAEAAQSAKANPISVAGPTPAPVHTTAPSMSYNQASHEPDRISPQALRESILVLQDQLQQRETRIEELEQELSTVDKDAPNKLKEKDSEINWLRELLGVRIDDLQDIIKTLSQPTFNKHAVRDAAIRLKANLQMQQQERERALSGGLGALPSIADIAASPRNLPLAAAAAWGNWRKGRENANGGSNSREQTPSKSSNTGGFLSGLLTPPSSHVRPNALPTGAPRPYTQNRPLRSLNSTPRRGSLRQEVPEEPPRTPPLLRRSSYDHDAEPGNYEEDNFATDDIESTVGGMVSAAPGDVGDEPFGPQISTLSEELAEE
ncbi:hypothetical protein N7470_009300 [Penicillium chermesinum]|nr:hypothetical protein N7470_009300 [Penicillium chermesinum]